MPDRSDPFDSPAQYRLEELCAACFVEEALVLEMIDVGILAPEGTDRAAWRFGTRAVIRLKRARRLQRDLEINLAGIAVTLDLLDELETAKRRVKTLETHLAQLIDND